MPRRTELGALSLVALLPGALAAQGGGGGRGVELHLGRWYNGNRAATYEVRTNSRLGRLLTHGFGATVIVHDTLGRRRAFYGLGYELQGWRGRASFGLYPLAALALGLSTDTSTQELAALWSIGGGLEWRPVSWLAVGTEVRYRLEDRGPRGFWDPRGDARHGLGLTLGISLGLGNRGGGGGRPEGRTGGGAFGGALLPPRPPATVGGNAAQVVQTALEALGTPYVWGGSAENGFDCSGLIQYAYGRYGISLPRTSRDQAKVGGDVSPMVDALRPGDILLFASVPGSGVTHVGLYVGELKFIHSSPRGVKLSRLERYDPDGAYWRDRWVGARRIIP